MPYHALLEYIRKAKDSGASDTDIVQRLHGAGWYKVDIQDALDLYARLTSNTTSSDYAPSGPPPKPGLADRIAPRHYDPHMIAIAAVSFALGYIAYVLLTHY